MDTLQECLVVAEEYAAKSNDIAAPISQFWFRNNRVQAKDLFQSYDADLTKHAYFQMMDRLGVRAGARFMWGDGRPWPASSTASASPLTKRTA